MDSDSGSGDGAEKTYTSLSNVNHESTEEYELQFEQFTAERSDNESEEDELFDKNDNSDLDSDVENNTNIENDNIDNLLDKFKVSSSSNDFLLKVDEAKIIESCKRADLKNLLILNRSKNFLLMQLFKKIKDHLQACRVEIQNLNEQYDQCNTIEIQPVHLTQLGAPYFKTKKEMFSSYANLDTLDRRRNGILSVYHTRSHKWSKRESDNVIRGVKLTYNHNKQKEILKKISSLRCEYSNHKKGSKKALQIVEQIDKLEEELKDLKDIGENDIPPIGKDDFIDWDHIALQYTKYKHPALDCRSFWHIYLHPNYDKSNWKPEENEKIKQLAIKYNKQNWEQITLELGTNRSAFSVCIHYLLTLCDHFSKVRFTKAEDNLLLRQIEKLRIGPYIPWSLIKTCFPERSKTQLFHRYNYFLNVGDHTSGSFTEAEDILLLILVKRFGKKFSKFSHFIPNRSHMQIKNRYNTNLQINFNRNCFTVDEDHILMNYMNDEKTKNVGGLVEVLNRNRDQLRQRYKVLKSFLNENPNAPLDEAPRRSIKRTKRDDERKYEFLKYMAEQFENQPDIPTVQEIEEKLGVKKSIKKRSTNNLNYDVDSLLVNFFSNSYKMKQNPLVTNSQKLEQISDQVFDILKIWKVNLKIPSELKKNNVLDIVDIELLNLLRDKFNQVEIDTSIGVEDLIAPNLNTFLGLKGLLQKNQLFRNLKIKSMTTLMDDLPLVRNKSDKQVTLEMIKMLKNTEPESRNRVVNERCLFLERFISSFLWPAVFSVEPPNDKIVTSENVKKTQENQNKEIKKRKRSTKTDIEPVRKKVKTYSIERKVSENAVRSSSRLSKMRENITAEEKITSTTSKVQNNSVENFVSTLRKVDKSEIENVLQNKKSVKLFMIQKIKMKDGTIKTITKPLDVNQIVPSNQNSCESSLPITKPKKHLDNLNILDLISIASSSKKDTQISENNYIDSENLSKDNVKEFYKKLSSKLTPLGETSTIPPKAIENRQTYKNYSKCAVEKDIAKLDAFLDKFQENDENDIDSSDDDIKKEISDLDKLLANQI